MARIPKRYIPKALSKEDKLEQKKELEKSRALYKKKRYYTRKKLKTFKSHPSEHLKVVRELYGIDKINIDEELSKKTGLTQESMRKIIKKGQGAYFSSGSRPNQTAHSWGLARLASAISGGKAAAVDFKIIKEGSNHKGKAYSLALEAKKKYGSGRGKAP